MQEAACIANIGPRERRRRLGVGVAATAVAAALLVVLLALDASRAWRILVGLPLWLGALGILQHRGKT